MKVTYLKKKNLMHFNLVGLAGIYSNILFFLFGLNAIRFKLLWFLKLDE